MTATFAITHHPPVALIEIRGELDITCRGPLAWRLVELASLDCPTVRVDLRDVTHIDACCLRLLDEARRTVTARQARFVVTHASTYVALVAELAGFHGLAPCAATAKKLQPTGGSTHRLAPGGYLSRHGSAAGPDQLLPRKRTCT